MTFLSKMKILVKFPFAPLRVLPTDVYKCNKPGTNLSIITCVSSLKFIIIRSNEDIFVSRVRIILKKSIKLRLVYTKKSPNTSLNSHLEGNIKDKETDPEKCECVGRFSNNSSLNQLHRRSRQTAHGCVAGCLVRRLQALQWMHLAADEVNSEWKDR